MLVFIDESGDLGRKFDRGSSPFFTVALVVFDASSQALACQRDIEELRAELKLPANYEFHFHSDRHKVRLAFLGIVAKHQFTIHTFTLDKQSARLTGPGFQHRSPGYKWVCRTVLDNASGDLRDATVVIDGSGERRFRKELATYLRRELNSRQRQQIGKVQISRSYSDSLLQLADYAASATNRLVQEKTGAEEYETFLLGKRKSQRIWP